jgi:phosphoglycerate dehydrogenase-like enzyme
VADLVFGLMIAAARHLLELDRAVREGRWTRILGRELHRGTLGLIGLGQVGRAVARRAAGFEMRILATDPAVSADVARPLGATLTSLETVLAEGDFVSVHVPLTAQTIHLVGEAELRRMKPTAYLINTARGGIVDEAALARALHEGWIAGAACDVFEREPPAGSPLLGAPRLILTPHIGAHTREAAARGATVAVDNLLAVLHGRAAPNVVNPDAQPSAL